MELWYQPDYDRSRDFRHDGYTRFLSCYSEMLQLRSAQSTIRSDLRILSFPMELFSHLSKYSSPLLCVERIQTLTPLSQLLVARTRSLAVLVDAVSNIRTDFLVALSESILVLPHVEDNHSCIDRQGSDRRARGRRRGPRGVGKAEEERIDRASQKLNLITSFFVTFEE